MEFMILPHSVSALTFYCAKSYHVAEASIEIWNGIPDVYVLLLLYTKPVFKPDRISKTQMVTIASSPGS